MRQALRTSRANVVPSIVDLCYLAGAGLEGLTQLVPLLETESNVFSITSRGTSAATGEVAEINLMVDRSALPVRILEYREN